MTTAPTAHTHEVLARVEANLQRVRSAEFERLELAREWALAHLVTDPDRLADPRRRPTPLGAVALPVDEYAGAEFAAALGLHPLAGRAWMADSVDVHDRLPSHWLAAAEGRIEVWVVRKVAKATADLSDEQARWVDAAVASVIGTLPPARFLTLVAARVKEADQSLADRKAEEAAAARMVWTSRHDEHGTRTFVLKGTSDGVRRLESTVEHLAHLLKDHGDDHQRSQSLDELRADAAELLGNPTAALKLMSGVDADASEGEVAAAIRALGPRATRPRAVVYLHLTPECLLGRGVARAEELGALTRQQLIELLGHHQVSLRPVIDLNDGMAADCHEVPIAVDERLQLAKPADVFPFATSTSRKLDRDHTQPYDDTGPPGQTAEEKLGKLTRHHHRIKTHGGWHVEQRDRRFTWVSPHGRVYVTDGNGTRQVRARSGSVPDLFWSNAA
jgi:hypothetical protein